MHIKNAFYRHQCIKHYFMHKVPHSQITSLFSTPARDSVLIPMLVEDSLTGNLLHWVTWSIAKVVLCCWSDLNGNLVGVCVYMCVCVVNKSCNKDKFTINLQLTIHSFILKLFIQKTFYDKIKWRLTGLTLQDFQQLSKLLPAPLYEKQYNTIQSQSI